MRATIDPGRGYRRAVPSARHETEFASRFVVQKLRLGVWVPRYMSCGGNWRRDERMRWETGRPRGL